MRRPAMSIDKRLGAVYMRRASTNASTLAAGMSKQRNAFSFNHITNASRSHSDRLQQLQIQRVLLRLPAGQLRRIDLGLLVHR